MSKDKTTPKVSEKSLDAARSGAADQSPTPGHAASTQGLPATAPLAPAGRAVPTPPATPPTTRNASGDFLLARIPRQYGSSTVEGRDGTKRVFAGGDITFMTKAQAERIGAEEVKAGTAQAEGRLEDGQAGRVATPPVPSPVVDEEAE